MRLTFEGDLESKIPKKIFLCHQCQSMTQARQWMEKINLTQNTDSTLQQQGW
jgi:hypothetical protein